MISIAMFVYQRVPCKKKIGRILKVNENTGDISCDIQLFLPHAPEKNKSTTLIKSSIIWFPMIPGISSQADPNISESKPFYTIILDGHLSRFDGM